ncbi:MAG: DUF305 domain-containing protein, partial [Gammaproteobacteria bacterium]|nr:DUF305 domain-containing protein [Gammaproteobacteria bacterium]
FRVTWPAEPVVARAYIDQLNRENVLSQTAQAGLADALGQAEVRLAAGKSDEQVAASLESIAASLDANAGSAIVRKRQAALADTLQGIAARLR